MTVYIKTHGRPNKQLTYNTLRDLGYTDKIIFMVDDEDDTSDLLTQYGEEIVKFHKQYYVDAIDCGSDSPKRDVNLYAWCACEDHAKSSHCDIFIMADDDITGFRYRYKEDRKLKSLRITHNLDTMFEYISEYMVSADVSAMSTGIPQMYFSGDIESSLWKWRVPYTFIFRNSKYRVNWVSEYEEDVITAINSANEGQYMFVFPMVQRDTVTMGSNEGGMHSSYSDNFKNSQYGYIWNPSCEEIIRYKGKYMCKIKRDNAFPKLISSRCKI